MTNVRNSKNEMLFCHRFRNLTTVLCILSCASWNGCLVASHVLSSEDVARAANLLEKQPPEQLHVPPPSGVLHDRGVTPPRRLSNGSLALTSAPPAPLSVSLAKQFQRTSKHWRKKWRTSTTAAPPTRQPADVSIPFLEEQLMSARLDGAAAGDEVDDMGSGEEAAVAGDDVQDAPSERAPPPYSPFGTPMPTEPLVTAVAPSSQATAAEAAPWTTLTDTTAAVTNASPVTTATAVPTTELPPCPETVEKLKFPDRFLSENQVLAKWAFKCPSREVTYNVTYTGDGSGDPAHVVHALTYNVTLFDLRAYTTYNVCVVALVATGAGVTVLNTAPSCADVTTKIGRPDRPENVTVVSVSSTAMTISWSPLSRYAGPTTFTVTLVSSTNTTASFANVTEVVMTHLTPFTDYCVGVESVTAMGTNFSAGPCRRTNPGVPATIENLSANCHVTECTVSFSPPAVLNGYLDYYDVTYAGVRSSSRRLQNGTERVTDTGGTTIRLGLGDLMPDSDYTFKIRAKTKDVEELGSASTVQSRTTSGVPATSDRPVDVVADAALNRKSQVKINVSRDLFTNDVGDITRYAVLVAQSSKAESPTSGANDGSGTPLRTWNDVRNQDEVLPYVTSPFGWNPFCGTCNHSVFVVGNDSTCFQRISYSERCNGPLRPGVTYSIKVRAYTANGYADSQLCTFRTESDKASIVVITIFTLLLAMISVSGFVVCLKRKNIVFKFVNMKKEEQLQNKIIHVEIPIPIRATAKPIQLCNFVEHIKMMSADSGLKFSQEFEELNAVNPTGSTTVAQLPENKAKNRWINILPFDDSRVKLLPIPDDVSTDYINASYIPGYRSPREYIATQGPLPSTRDDFWRMVWEQNSPMIVMVTQCIERGKAKCEEYWPTDREKHYYGDLAVRLKSESILSGFTIRIFDLELTLSQGTLSSSTLSIDVSDHWGLIPLCPELEQGTRVTEVKQLHFTMWPDFGCPENTTLLLNFVRSVRDHLPRGDDGPIVVHCSAGVGRTGTFIAVDRLMQHVSDGHDSIDVYATVRSMRQHRTNMVQTEDQYVYIHQCIRDLLREAQEVKACLPTDSADSEMYTNLDALHHESEKEST